ncbi:MAG: multicopper oxidase family protein [Nanoarchaeota archaeon]|nr:multicopper oxidase family protein [Nanoarchaeota archaeon]
MKQLSKKEKFRLEKQKAKRNKKIIIWTFVILILGSISYLIMNSAKNSPNFENPIVNSNEVPSGQIHWHPKLTIKLDGEIQTIPNNIGLAPGRHSPTHTHDEGDGTIHLENPNPRAQPETMALGFFFNLWKQPFNQTCILDKCTNVNGGEIKMYVNGKENTLFEDYVFKGEDEIVIEYISMPMKNMDESMENSQMNMEMDMPNSDSKTYSRDIMNLESAQKSEILNLKNNDKIDLSIDIVKKEIAGKEIRMFGYNGQIPGPLLKVEQGASVYVNVTNNLDVDTTVHWHGLRLENEFDGVPGQTMDTQMPGSSFEYKLDFVDEGIYWYHPHVREDYQQELGLYGNMLVDSKYEDYYNNVNTEIPLILDDILIENGDVAPFYKDHGDRTLMGRFGNIMLINGDDNYNLEVNKGEVIRFYLTSVANTRMFNFSIPGVELKLVGGDIGSYEKEKYVDSIIIAPAERYTIEAYFKEEGEYEIKNINPENEYVLGNIKVNSKVTSQDYSSEFLSLRENNYVKEDIDSFREYFEKAVDVQIDLTIETSMNLSMDGMNMNMEDSNMMGEDTMMMDSNSMNSEMDNMMEEDEDHKTTIEWEDEMEMMNKMSTSESLTWVLQDSNKNKNMDIDLDFKVGDKVKIRLFNDPNSKHPMQHPIHFHGQRFLVLEKDGVKSDNLVWKDTVLVPVGSSVDILLDVTNPGEWMAHCHIAEHLEAGMMMSFNVEAN